MVNCMVYLYIFICKILENSIGTLRMIIVSNGKKIEGAILNFILSFIWIISISLVVLNNNIYKILNIDNKAIIISESVKQLFFK